MESGRVELVVLVDGGDDVPGAAEPLGEDDEIAGAELHALRRPLDVRPHLALEQVARLPRVELHRELPRRATPPERTHIYGDQETGAGGDKKRAVRSTGSGGTHLGQVLTPSWSRRDSGGLRSTAMERPPGGSVSMLSGLEPEASAMGGRGSAGAWRRSTENGGSLPPGAGGGAAVMQRLC